MSTKTLTVSAACLSIAVLLSLTAWAQEPRGGPSFRDGTNLNRPTNYREWQFLSSSLNMSYHPPGDVQPQLFQNVFVNPSSYRGFMETGRSVYAQSDDPAAWDPQAAAAYLDQRLEWWSGWENAARERGTFCISCHTTGPYGLARPMLRSGDAADTPTQHEQTLLTSVTTRVTHWSEIGPFYTDERYGSPKTSESRGTEAIFNALILARRDAVSGALSETTEQAFDHLWALQETSGQAEGAWPWLHFNLAPWESDEGTYHGAALAAVAVGLAPDEYRARPEIHDHVARLRDYLRRRVDAEPPFTRVMAVWAETALPGTLTFAQQSAIIDDVVGRQRPDGGWSLSSLGSWERSDDTAVDQTSDGYATGLVTLALRTAGQPRAQAAIARGLVWLERNQSPDGSWPATSLNRQHDPASERAGFMRDAATAYAVLALTAHKDD